VERLGAERVGHGIAAVSDSRLLDRLRDEGITLEVCPSSNVCTGVVASLAEHPLPALMGAGVSVALGSDDPPMFNTSLLDEYRRARDVMRLDASPGRSREFVRLPTIVDPSLPRVAGPIV
jgi:adenosine deaminase